MILIKIGIVGFQSSSITPERAQHLKPSSLAFAQQDANGIGGSNWVFTTAHCYGEAGEPGPT